MEQPPRDDRQDGMPLLRCTCGKCTPETIKNVLDATARLEMLRDARELRVGHAGVKLDVGDVSDFRRPEPTIDGNDWLLTEPGRSWGDPIRLRP